MEKTVLARFKELLQQRPGLAKMVLFGSRARGDADPDSDVDVLVVWAGEMDDETREHISDCAWQAGFEHGLVVVPVAFSRKEWEEGPERYSIFAQAVERDGVSI